MLTQMGAKLGLKSMAPKEAAHKWMGLIGVGVAFIFIFYTKEIKLQLSNL